ncbi:MipA/OmpV family protein [Paracoccus jeotgali]|uniref:MipA/OmpV family protein n=1 Tax=Paracoccus jeotgali TaxID=2065379 RepID=A0A2K9MCE3_9RHOB|nr:MipA/OmpV family protein [Paracoccus jeotgali]AUM73317.1 MipA/OmpV family protein [Paracoccus jeotgali]
MTRILPQIASPIAALVLAAGLASPAAAQTVLGKGQNKVAVDIGLGGAYSRTYKGSDEFKTRPWLILRDLALGGAGPSRDEGFRLSLNTNMVGPRNEDDDDRLEGLDDISRAYEFGIKATYNMGQTTGYATLRKGFGGHHGLTGEIGGKYRFEAGDRMTLWAGLKAGWGNARYNDTYFGVTDIEAARSDYTEYAPGNGFNSATASIEARYQVNPATAILGEMNFGRIIGDSADSPVVRDRNQPSVKLGIVRTLNFAF